MKLNLISIYQVSAVWASTLSPQEEEQRKEMMVVQLSRELQEKGRGLLGEKGGARGHLTSASARVLLEKAG
jgi:hypothetical protein